MKFVLLLTVPLWILEAWHLIFPEIVENSFKVTGISNEMDCNEDFMINAIGIESEKSDDGNDGSIGSDSEWQTR
jgi:hypothetical protein